MHKELHCKKSVQRKISRKKGDFPMFGISLEHQVENLRKENSSLRKIITELREENHQLKEKNLAIAEASGKSEPATKNESLRS